MNDRFEGEHVSAWRAGRVVFVRNKDNICSATVARGGRFWGTHLVWAAFLAEASRAVSFDDAVDFFERHGLAMSVRG